MSDTTAPGDPSEQPLEGMKPRSFEVTDGPTRAPARAMLRAVGMTDEDWDKPQIGVASSWNEVTPCNLPLDRLAKRAKEGVRAAGGFPLEFVTIAVSDGISMGHEGMRASLVSREVIADSVETMMHAERFDGMVTFAGCDKSLPGMLMAAARLNLPSVFLYGGSILPGRVRDRALDIVSVFEAVGANAAGRPHRRGAVAHRAQRLPDRGLVRRDVHRQHHGVGGRGAGHVPAGQLVGPRGRPPARRRRLRIGPGGRRAARAGIRPRQIMTKAAFENAIAVVMALGGSTNAVLHLLAIANEARVELTLDDFNRWPPGCPTSPTPSPTGATTWSTSTGSAACRWCMRELLDAGLLHGDCITVTGRTMAENLAALDPPAPDGDVVHAARRPDPRRRAASPSSRARSPRRARWSRWPASTS